MNISVKNENILDENIINETRNLGHTSSKNVVESSETDSSSNVEKDELKTDTNANNPYEYINQTKASLEK